MDRGNRDDPDTTYNFDTNASPPDPVTPRWSSLYPAEQYSSCPKAVKGLTYEWDNMKTLVDSMYAAGNTNQAIGLQVGWMSLVGGGPFTVPAMDPDFKYQQVIILLTDGLNTQDRWYNTATDIDARQQIACDNVKSGQNRSLHHSGQHWRRSDIDPAAELRQRSEKVLSFDVGRPDYGDVPGDRHQPHQAAGGAIKTT